MTSGCRSGLTVASKETSEISVALFPEKLLEGSLIREVEEVPSKTNCHLKTAFGTPAEYQLNIVEKKKMTERVLADKPTKD